MPNSKRESGNVSKVHGFKRGSLVAIETALSILSPRRKSSSVTFPVWYLDQSLEGPNPISPTVTCTVQTVHQSATPSVERVGLVLDHSYRRNHQIPAGEGQCGSAWEVHFLASSRHSPWLRTNEGESRTRRGHVEVS
jgi:hypothetical protein